MKYSFNFDAEILKESVIKIRITPRNLTGTDQVIEKKERQYASLMRRAFESAIRNRKKSNQLNSQATELLSEIHELKQQMA